MPKLYTPEDFENAIAAIKCGLSYRKASLQFGVPKSTLTDRITGRKHKGAQVVFTSQEEEAFVEYFKKLAERENGLNSLDVRNTIKCWLDRDNRKISRFTDNMPTSNWVTQFKKRHPSLKIKRLKNPSVKMEFDAKPTTVVEVVEMPAKNVETVNKVSPDSTQETLFDQNVQQSSLIDRNVHESSLIDRNVQESSLVDRNVQESSLVDRNVQESPLIDRNVQESSLLDRNVHESIVNRNVHESIVNRNGPSTAGCSSVNSDQLRINETLSAVLPVQSKNYIALKALEETLTEHELAIFHKRYEETHNIEIDVLYNAWKVLKNRCANESPTMVNNYIRPEKRASYLPKSMEVAASPIAEETMHQIQQIIINKYKKAEVDTKPSVIVTTPENNHL